WRKRRRWRARLLTLQRSEAAINVRQFRECRIRVPRHLGHPDPSEATGLPPRWWSGRWVAVRSGCVGAGAAWVSFAVSAKLRDAGHEITVYDRDPPAATYGWGVVYWDDLLDVLYRNDPESAQEVTAKSVLWQDQELRVRGSGGEQTAHFGGYGYSI